MWVLAIVGCGYGPSEDRSVRVWEMQDHEGAALAARDAILAGDLDALHAAGADLARPDEVPGIPAAGRAPLDAVRAHGQALAALPDLEPAQRTDAAHHLVAMTAACAACHHALAVEAVAPLSAAPRDAVWTALVFESEDRWQTVVRGIGAETPSLAAATDWADRRDVVARLLDERRL
ncbi:MAG: hypothetical protein ABMB14_16385 [Myxococcota bacterium]